MLFIQMHVTVIIPMNAAGFVLPQFLQMFSMFKGFTGNPD
jgi:hypothetical protein